MESNFDSSSQVRRSVGWVISKCTAAAAFCHLQIAWIEKLWFARRLSLLFDRAFGLCLALLLHSTARVAFRIYKRSRLR
jgi:hypothetical protein